MESLLRMAGLEDWPVPDCSTLCRRQKAVTIQIPFRRSDAPLNLLVDSTGVKMRAEGEWQVRRHGPGPRRQWRKAHLAMDVATEDIHGVEFTSSQTGDSPVPPDLLAQIPDDQPVGTVTADGAYDTRTCHAAIAGRGGTAIIPIRKNGRPWKEDRPAARARNGSLRATRRFGRAFWKRLTGNHARAGSKPGCAGSRASASGSPRETPTAKPPGSMPAQPS